MFFKKIAFIIGILFLAFDGYSQYFQFSQSNYTQQRLNPASVSASDHARVALIYRQQKVSDGFNVKSSYLESSYPLFNKKGRWSGIGISLLDDRSGYGGMFRTNEIGLSYSLSVPMKKYSSLNLGFRTVYQNKRISFDGLTTGTQYVPGQGMIGANNGEDLDNFSTDFLTFSSGIYWQSTDRHHNKLAYAGISLFDFNRPQDSFYSEKNKLSSTWIVNGGIRVYDKNGFSILPGFLFTHSAAKGTLSVGPVFTYDLYESMYSKRPGKVNLITKYATGDYLVAGIQFEKEKFAIGFSYDIPVGENVANQGAIEFGAEFKQLIKNNSKKKIKKNKIKKKKKAIKKKKKASKKKARNFKKSKRKSTAQRKKAANKTPEKLLDVAKDTFIQKELPEEVQPEKKVVETPPVVDEEKKELQKETEEEKEETPQIAKTKNPKYLPLELEDAVLHFNFEFGKKQINEESKAYLRELVAVLKSDDLLKIIVIGHTDDVGSESFNLELSLERARVVKDFLISEGVADERIIMNGKGESEPLVENTSEEGRAKNRRVDFKIGY